MADFYFAYSCGADSFALRKTETQNVNDKEMNDFQNFVLYCDEILKIPLFKARFCFDYS